MATTAWSRLSKRHKLPTMHLLQLTLDSGGGADDEGLLEGFSLSTQLSGTGLQGDAGLGQAWDVYGRLLVKCGLVVEERNSSASRWNLGKWPTVVNIQWKSLWNSSINNQEVFPLTWLCWFSWLLKVTVRFPAVPGTALAANRALPLSKLLFLLLQMSMFWKHDFTLQKLCENKLKTHIYPNEPVLDALKRTYCELCGKFSRWLMVTNGCARVFVGVILLSASSLSILFSRSINSRRSAFSANMSVPSKWVGRLTWKQINAIKDLDWSIRTNDTFHPLYAFLITCIMSSKQLKMYFLASFDLMPISDSCSEGV